MKLKLFLLAAVASLAVSSAGALSVSFQIIQRDPSDHNIRSSTYLIEESMFDYFFDMGVVLSNVPAICSEKESKDKYLFDRSLKEAAEGGVKFFVELLCFYDTSNSTNPEAAKIDNIEAVEWKVLDVKSGNVVGSGKNVPPKVPSKNSQKSLSDFSRGIAQDVYRTMGR